MSGIFRSFCCSLSCALFLSFFAIGNANAADKSMIIIDASGSMWGKINGKTKIAIARETLATVLKSVPADRELGLMAYGHRKKGQCSDIQQLVAPAKANRDAISKAVARLNPKGKTPLADSVRQAADKLRYTEDKATVILITDGLETCAPDPCKVASELEATGLDFVVHVVGFGLSEEQGKKVACLAENTGGQFILANKAAELGAALTETVVKAPAPTSKPKVAAQNVFVTVALAEGVSGVAIGGKLEFFKLNGDKPEKRAARLKWGESIETRVEPGRYLMRYTKDLVVHESIVAVPADGVFKQEIVLNAGVVTLGIAGADGQPANKKARVDISHEGRKSGAWGPHAFVVPAGVELPITGKLGKATISDSIVVEAGQQTEQTLVASVGELVVTAVYTDGGETADKGVRHTVVPAKEPLSGNKKTVTGSWGNGKFLLPPGDYIIESKLGKATASTPVTVTGDEQTRVVVNLNGGVLAITAAGARRVSVKTAKADIQGKHRDMGGKWGPKYQGVLPPGDYIAVASFKGKKETLEKLVTVKAGERTAATLP